MEGRGVFTLNGLIGGLIATVILLSILVFLTMGAISTQQSSANDFYMIENEKAIKMISKENAKHVVDVK